jgi:REP element-mobilizing transposase RayT
VGQLAFGFDKPPAKKGRGGARDGAGRPKTSDRVPHTRRPPITRHKPVHVTVKTVRGTWNLRSQRCFTPIRRALAALAERASFRLVQFSVQHDHIHMIVEADHRRALSEALRTMLIRVARGLNRLMGVRGRRFGDRYHEHILKTPTETRNALRYVLRNRGIHRERWGRTRELPVDPFSSESDALSPLLRAPSSWLLREGWSRAGPID